MSRLRANQITNENANGAPNFPHGLTVTGVVTATTAPQTMTSIVVGSAVTANSQGIDVTGIVTATTVKVGSAISATDGAISATRYFGDGSSLTGTSAGLQSMNVFTSTGTSTWNKPSGITKVKVYVTGGGGGCSGVGGDRADDIGAGGAAGGTAIKIIDVSSISSVTVTVGMGGTAKAANSGAALSNDGQTSSFGSHCTATGGIGGKSYFTDNAAIAGHAIPGVGSGGDLNLRGGYGNLPICNYNGAPAAISGGLGGVSFWGGPGRGALDDNFTGGSHDISGGGSTGNSAGAFGSGGSAGSRDLAGGAGTHGVVVVENYA